VAIDRDELPSQLQLHQVGEHGWEAEPEPHADDIARNVVFGGQILAQMIMAAHRDREAAGPQTKDVKSIHAIFARAGDYRAPIVYEVERMHDGRTMGSDSVSFSQGGRVMARGLILWSNDEPDLIRHTLGVEMPDAPRPVTVPPESGLVFPGATALVVEGTAIDAHEARVNLWTRFGETFHPVANQAILSWATDGYLIGAALAPHAEYSEADAHRTISTGVLSHTVNFHDRFEANDWLLLAHEGIWAGRGRSYGRCNVWAEDGRLVATYTQDSMVRAMPAASGGPDRAM